MRFFVRYVKLLTMAAQRRSIIWIDAGGRTTQSLPLADPNCSAIMAALENHSEAAVAEWFEGPPTFPGGAPAGGTFADVADLARLTFVTAAGDSVTVSLPAPAAAIFKPDTVTVDPSAIADIIAACVGHLATPSGVTVASYVIGVRNQRASGR